MATSNPQTGFLINELASTLLLAEQPSTEPTRLPKNSDWVRMSFVVDTDRLGEPTLDKQDAANREFSSASIKYTDTSPGGNLVINPFPSFTRYCDVPDKGIRFGAIDTTVQYIPGELGMGPMYSEMFDDNMQQIHMSFGVAQHNSLLQFFTGFYSSDLGNAARSGRFTDNFFQKFLRLGGQVIGLALAPLAIIPLAFLMAGTAFRYFMNWPTSQFYTVRITMETYWTAVNAMFNEMNRYSGMSPTGDAAQTDNVVGQEHRFAPADYSVFSALFPEFCKDGRVDVYALSNKAKRMQGRYDYLRKERFEKAAATGEAVTSDAYFGVIRGILKDQKGEVKRHPYASDKISLENWLQRYWDRAKALSWAKADDKSNVLLDIKSPDDLTETEQRIPESERSFRSKIGADSLIEYFLANEGDGNRWVSFRVDYTGPVTDSFSNTTTESTLAAGINGISRTAKDIRMNFGGAVGAIPGLETVLGGLNAVLSGAVSTLHMEGFYAAAGSAFTHIPDHWDSSSATLGTTNYSFTLISPSADPVSQAFSIRLPLCCILAGVLPLATGKQSSTSPFLCTIHDRGRFSSQTCIIESLTITRGSSNTGFNNEGTALAIEVSFNVKPLNKQIAMPIQSGFSLLGGLFDGENAFTDYLMAMSAMKLSDMTYRIPMLKYQLQRKKDEFNAFTSASHFAAWAASIPGASDILRAASQGTDRK